jgi:hypothetical protein
MSRLVWLILAISSMVSSGLAAQVHEHTPGMTHPATDSAYSALKDRGGKAMLVNQDSATHLFDALPDGGRIELQADTDDPKAIAGIREHFGMIEAAFRRGDFSTPFFVHDKTVPGTAVMSAKQERIRYTRADLPRGAELRLQSTDRAVIAAIHDFMAFQRGEHRAGGASSVR